MGCVTDATQIDWSSAAVDDGQLTVALTGKPTSDWADTVTDVAERLQQTGRRFGTVQVSKKKLRVDGVTPGSEADVRHLLESAVLQANAAVSAADDEDGDEGEDRSGADQEMTDAFRAFGDDAPDVH
jgi:hypothetical protein